VIVCPRCNYDFPRPIRWTLELAFDIPSQNDIAGGKGNSRWRYKKLRDEYRLLVKHERIRLRIPTATGRRRVTITRHYGGRCKERDRGNLVGGAKALMDALVLEGLLVDDAPSWVDDWYQQEPTSAPTWVAVEIEELNL
jgi:hypothetical protein